MELQQMQQLTGCLTFYDCYKWLKKENKLHLGVITFQQKKKRVDLVVKDVVAAAGLEVLEKLPTDNSILIMHDVLEDVANSKEKSLIHSFLNNLLTK